VFARTRPTHLSIRADSREGGSKPYRRAGGATVRAGEARRTRPGAAGGRCQARRAGGARRADGARRAGAARLARRARLLPGAAGVARRGATSARGRERRARAWLRQATASAGSFLAGELPPLSMH